MCSRKVSIDFYIASNYLYSILLSFRLLTLGELNIVWFGSWVDITKLRLPNAVTAPNVAPCDRSQDPRLPRSRYLGHDQIGGVMKTRTPRRVITVLTSDLMTARARAIKCIFVRSDTAPATRHTSAGLHRYCPPTKIIYIRRWPF